MACAVQCNLRIGKDGPATPFVGKIRDAVAQLTCGTCCTDAASGWAADTYHPITSPDLGYAQHTGIVLNQALASSNAKLPTLKPLLDAQSKFRDVAYLSTVPTMCNQRRKDFGTIAAEVRR